MLVNDPRVVQHCSCLWSKTEDSLIQLSLECEYSLSLNKADSLLANRIQQGDRIRREYYEQFYAGKFNNLDEINQFLEIHKLSKHTLEEIDHLNSTLSN